MTTPNERARSLIWAGGFLIELARDKRLPLDVRRNAVVIARHFPTAGDISFAASQSPLLGLDLELESAGAIAAWAKDCSQGLLHEFTLLAWPEED
ncbi:MULTISPECIES: BPSL0761 family protein [unclassified Rhodanobacter]|jgi:hypothetical protein|uniref:BPSL0761 family protein n=1 Tax=unclassified Rhodanobacter TaxID=2621553 RepID=UPI0009ECE1AB|nr:MULTISPECIES: BPSL0761 family protein [unclassified Rhodanobacter]